MWLGMDVGQYKEILSSSGALNPTDHGQILNWERQISRKDGDSFPERKSEPVRLKDQGFLIKASKITSSPGATLITKQNEKEIKRELKRAILPSYNCRPDPVFWLSQRPCLTWDVPGPAAWSSSSPPANKVFFHWPQRDCTKILTLVLMIFQNHSIFRV